MGRLKRIYESYLDKLLTEADLLHLRAYLNKAYPWIEVREQEEMLPLSSQIIHPADVPFGGPQNRYMMNLELACNSLTARRCGNAVFIFGGTYELNRKNGRKRQPPYLTGQGFQIRRPLF